MATIVFFHAHPDDEVMGGGGSMCRAAAEGHRVILVVATNGDFGEVPEDLADGETLTDRRRAETAKSASILGVDKVVWLGYRDSGMTGWPQNDDPECFWQADLDEAATRLADVLTAEDATVLVAYDWHGGYGHPDHVKVHRVGHRAAEKTGVKLFETTWNRDVMRAMAAEMPTPEGADGEAGEEWNVDGPADDGNPIGEPASAIHWSVDVSPYVSRKRAAIACHASQTSDAGSFAAMPEDAFNHAFAVEWFIEPGRPLGDGPLRGWLFATS